MRLRSILLGILLCLSIAAGRAWALDPFGQDRVSSYVVAQAAEPRVTQLEEMVRRLTGQIEELNFQVLQMQDQLRKIQEDNEFRFQELEGRSPGTGERSGRLGEDDGSSSSAQGPNGTHDHGADPAGGNISQSGEPRILGTITFDEFGNSSGGTLQVPGAPDRSGPGGGDIVAALPRTEEPDELYRNAYEFILSGDYSTAEAGFREHIERFPSDSKAADAHYWLGESLLGQERYRDAAETFLDASRDFPDARKAPDMMLKLGISLAALDQRDVACATYGEIARRYPGASQTLLERVKQEQALAGC